MRKPAPFALKTLSRVLSGLLLGFSLPVQAQPESIGRVLVIRGAVEARDASGAVRVLARASELFQSDTILVGADGYAQLKMVDDARITLKSDTEFAFNTYSFDNNAATPDSAAMSMVRGGFMTISGTIGDADEDDYRVDTPYASIGIRGTMHSALIVDGGLLTGVYDGGTTISNNQGSIDAGVGADFDFTETRNGEAPRGLIEAPAVLGQIEDLTPALDALDDAPPAGTDGDATEAADAQNAAGNQPAGDNTEPPPNFALLGGNNAADPANNGPNVVVVTDQAEVDTDTENARAALTRSQAATTNITGDNPQDELNPLLFSRDIVELDETPANNGNGGGNAGNGAGNGGSSSGGGNGTGNGGSSSGGDTGNGNAGSGSGNGNGNGGSSSGGGTGNGSAGSGSGNGNGNGGSSPGGDTGNGNAGSGSGNGGSTPGGNTGNGNSGGSSGNGNGNGGSTSVGDTGSGNSGGSSGNGNGNGGSTSGGDTGSGNSGGSSGNGNGNGGSTSGGDTGSGNSGGSSGNGNGNGGSTSGGDTGSGNSGGSTGNGGSTSGGGTGSGNSGGGTGNGGSTTGGSTSGSTGNGNSGGNTGSSGGSTTGGGTGAGTGGGNSGSTSGNGGTTTGNGNGGGNANSGTGTTSGGTSTGTGGTSTGGTSTGGTSTGNGNGGNGNGGGSANGSTTVGSSVGSGSTTTTTGGTNVGPTNNGNGGGNANAGGGSGNGNKLAIRPQAIQEASNFLMRPDSQLLQWGVWDTASPVSQNNIQRIIGSFFNTNATQAVLIPADMADLSGTVSYDNTTRFAGMDGTGAALQNVEMSFTVNLGGGPGAISNGQLLVVDGKQGVWKAGFQGDVANSAALMTNVNGTYGINPLTGAIQGVFTGTGALPDFVTGFVLESGGNSVQGLTVLDSN